MAFVPYMIGAIVVDAVHIHPVTGRSPLFALGEHSLTAALPPTASAPGYVCPACSWQRDQSRLDTRVPAPATISTTTIIVTPPTIDRPDGPAILPSPFRGPPALPLI